MLLPSVFGEDLFDETFPFAGMTDRHGHDKLFGNRAGRLMKTDVREGGRKEGPVRSPRTLVRRSEPRVLRGRGRD